MAQPNILIGPVPRLDRISESLIGDPIPRFSESLRIKAVSLERRSDKELSVQGLEHPDPVEREYALYQLLHRRGELALPVVFSALRQDPDAQVKVNVLWCLEDLATRECAEIALELAEDKDSRVREWARVFCWEMGWSEEDFRQARKAVYYEGRTFDETIFLHIRCHLYIRLGGNNMWGHVVLSPQMLARVYGQAMACPITETREHQLVISKTLKGLHDDGSDHYEAFLFKGFTERTSRLSGSFYFESATPRPFYLSGKADDMSEGVVENVPIPFCREGEWFLNENLKVKDNFAIEYVRGLFQGWAFVNLERIQKTDGNFLFPGNSVLSTLHHPVIGPRTNTFIFGSFKGKVLDWNDDGILDLNYLPAYATAKGEIDSDLDGQPDVPGLSVCSRPVQG